MSFVQTHLVSVSLSASPPTPPRRNHAVRKKYQFIITSFPVLWVKYMMPHAVGPCPVPPKSPKTRAGKDNFLPQNEQHLERLLAKSVAHERAKPILHGKSIAKGTTDLHNFSWNHVTFFKSPKFSMQCLLESRNLCWSHKSFPGVIQPLWESRNPSESRETFLRVAHPLRESGNLF